MPSKNQKTPLPNMSDWLPNWKDANQYPKSKSITLGQWSWEFLRRNRKYSSMWFGFFEGYYRQPKLFNRIQKLEAIRQRDGSMAFISSDKDLQRPCELANQFAYFFRLTTFPPVPWENNVAIKFEREKLINNPGNVEINLNKDELAIIYNLRLPAKEQMRHVESILKDAKKSRGIKEDRVRTDMYPIYLRILDAKTKRTSDAEIAKRLFPGDRNEPPEYQANSKVRDRYKSARELRDKDFWMISVKQK